MEDPNIIACLFAAADEVDGKGLSQFAVEAINLNNNERRFEPLVKREPKPAPERPSRESLLQTITAMTGFAPIFSSQGFN